MDVIEKHVREICGRFKNVHVLQREYVEFHDCIMLGATLWTDLPHRDNMDDVMLADELQRGTN